MEVLYDMNNKNRIIALLLTVVCLLFSGCSNEFAKEEYNSNDKIAQMSDKYAKVQAVMSNVNDNYELTAAQFDGRQTLYSDDFEESRAVKLDISLALSEGKAKIVHIDDKDNVTTLVECTPETSTDGIVSKTVTFTAGYNRVKIVGYECKDLKVRMMFDD